MSHDEAWEQVGSLEELGSGELLASMVGDEEIVLCRAGDEVFALHNWCTHADARLSEGRLEGYELQCPLHEGKFDVRNGRALCAPAETDVRSFPVRVVGTEIQAKPK
ncbi:MAG: non-heme iron oxygenase ferredoxin subunit [Betaproteobacteria bacterium]